MCVFGGVILLGWVGYCDLLLLLLLFLLLLFGKEKNIDMCLLVNFFFMMNTKY